MSAGWITIREAAVLYGLSRRQALRRLGMLNAQHGGRLLRWSGKPGGRLEVNSEMLRQVLRADPLDRERDLAEVHERIDVLDGRTNALARLVRLQKKTLAEQAKAIEGLAQPNSARSGVSVPKQISLF